MRQLYQFGGHRAAHARNRGNAVADLLDNTKLFQVDLGVVACHLGCQRIRNALGIGQALAFHVHLAQLALHALQLAFGAGVINLVTNLQDDAANNRRFHHRLQRHVARVQAGAYQLGQRGNLLARQGRRDRRLDNGNAVLHAALGVFSTDLQTLQTFLNERKLLVSHSPHLVTCSAPCPPSWRSRPDLPRW